MAVKASNVRTQEPDAGDRAKAAAARAEVVDILAGALFSLLLEGRLSPPKHSRPEQHRECS